LNNFKKAEFKTADVNVNHYRLSLKRRAVLKGYPPGFRYLPDVAIAIERAVLNPLPSILWRLLKIAR